MLGVFPLFSCALDAFVYFDTLFLWNDFIFFGFSLAVFLLASDFW